MTAGVVRSTPVGGGAASSRHRSEKAHVQASQDQSEHGGPRDLVAAIPVLLADLQRRREEHQSAGHTEPLMVSVPADELFALYSRLLSQPVIEQAKGVLMGAYRLDEHQAFQVLVRYSQSTNVKIRTLAQTLVTGQSRTDLHPAELLNQTKA